MAYKSVIFFTVGIPALLKLLMYSLKYRNFRLETPDIKEGRITRPIIR